MSSTALINSTCLISVRQIGKLDLLRGVFDSIVYPPAVQAEVGESVE